MSYIIGTTKNKSGQAAQPTNGGNIKPTYKKAVINGDIAIFDVLLPLNYLVLYNGQTLTKNDFEQYSTNEVRFKHALNSTDTIYFVEFRFIPTSI
jgi:hypothetical protein